MAKKAKKTTKLSAPVKRAVQKIVRRQEETKYHAEQLLSKNQLDWSIHTIYDPVNAVPVGDILPLVPRISLGDESHQRSGKKVRPTKCRVDVEVSIAEAPTGLPQFGVFTNDLYVVMYLVRPKTTRNFEVFAAQKNTIPQWQLLLDNGDSTSKAFGNPYTPTGGSQFWYSNASDLQLPVNSEYFTLIKKRVVRLTKNTGGTNQDGTGVSTNIGRSSWRGSFTYKLPTLIYDDQSTVNYTGGYPTNTAPMLMIGSCLANGDDSVLYTSGEIVNVLPNPIQLNVRTHCWYKDA